MFKNLFSKSKIETQFLVIPELNFDDIDEFLDIVKIHNVEESTAINFDSYRQLVYEKGKLIKAFDFEDQTKLERILIRSEKDLPFKDFEKNKFLTIEINEVGINQLGGTLPNDVNFNNISNVSFQYLGFVSNKNENLNFVNTKIHLIAPIYSDFEKIYIDYSIQSEIQILDIDENIDEIENLYDETEDKNEKITFQTEKFNFKENYILGEIGHSGIPLWIQYPEIPKCPKTGQTMKFLLQLNSGPKILESPQNFSEEIMQFSGGNGNLYIFYCPESKIACYINQNS